MFVEEEDRLTAVEDSGALMTGMVTVVSTVIVFVSTAAVVALVTASFAVCHLALPEAVTLEMTSTPDVSTTIEVLSVPAGQSIERATFLRQSLSSTNVGKA